MASEDKSIAPTRWAVFELEPDVDGRARFWLVKTARSDLEAWAARDQARLAERAPGPILRFRLDWSTRFQSRSRKSSVQSLRRKLVRAIERTGGQVVPDKAVVVYAIELEQPTADQGVQLYVGVTSNLDKRLAEHRGEIEDGTPPGRAVIKFGFGRYRDDLVADFREVTVASADDLESQVSALLAMQGFKVHGDGSKRPPTSSAFVTGVSWQQLHGAYERANGLTDR